MFGPAGLFFREAQALRSVPMSPITKRVLLAFGTAILLPPALVVGGFYAWENGTAALAWRAAERTLRDAGEPLTRDELRPAPVADADNMAAAPVFRELFTIYSPRRASVYGLQLPPPAALGPEAEPELIALARRFDPAFRGDATAAAKIILDGLAPMDPLLEAVRLAARRPASVWPEKADARDEAQARIFAPLRRTAEVLAARAAAAMADRQSARAFDDFTLVARLAHAQRPPPSLASAFAGQVMLGHAIDIVAEGLAQDAWSDDELARIEATLAAFAPLADFQAAVRGERVMFLDSEHDLDQRARAIFTIVDFRSQTSAVLSRLACRVAWALRPSGWLSRDRVRYVEQTQAWLDVVIHQGFVRPWALADWNAGMRRLRWNVFEFFKTPLSGLVLPTFATAARSAAHTQARLDCARLACALARYRRAHGALPADLTALAPHWIPRVPRDVVGGAPYAYQPMAGDRYVLYGRGWNARDDGGSADNANPLLGPATADDWVWASR